MTTSISESYIENINQSVLFFLNNESYIRSGSGSFAQGNLNSFFTNLDIRLGHYPNLEKVPLPALALIPPVNLSGGEYMAYGDHLQILQGSYQIQGYMGRQASHQDNVLQRDRLATDCSCLFHDQEYITLRELNSSNALIDTGFDIGISNISLNYIPPSEQPEASRYRFTIEFDVEYIKKI